MLTTTQLNIRDNPQSNLNDANSVAETRPILSPRDLYARIRDFSLDEYTAELSFSERLQHENGWSADYAERVIDEYRRFMYLAVTADHAVTPSDQVDQVWHLHLTYTRSYWQDFCARVLRRAVHHEPTRGGEAESEKYREQYEKTLASYESIFGEAAPASIWPPVSTRFGQDLQFERINTGRNWIIPRTLETKVLGLAALLVVLFPLGVFSYAVDKLGGIGLILVVWTFLGAVGLLFGNKSDRGGDKQRSGGCGGCGCGGCGG